MLHASFRRDGGKVDGGMIGGRMKDECFDLKQVSCSMNERIA